jgi:hypothetical protein
MQECRVCLGPHEEEIHAATVRVMEWFRWEVTRSFVEEEEAAMQEETATPIVAA